MSPFVNKSDHTCDGIETNASSNAGSIPSQIVCVPFVTNPSLMQRRACVLDVYVDVVSFIHHHVQSYLLIVHHPECLIYAPRCLCDQLFAAGDGS